MSKDAIEQVEEGVVSELLPCPFCGEQPEIIKSAKMYGGGHQYSLDCCFITVEYWYDSFQELATAWNKRAA